MTDLSQHKQQCPVCADPARLMGCTSCGITIPVAIGGRCDECNEQNRMHPPEGRLVKREENTNG